MSLTPQCVDPLSIEMNGKSIASNGIKKLTGR